MSKVQNVKVTRDDTRWEVELAAEIPAIGLANARAEAIKEIGSTAQISGFRPGHIPEAVLVRHFGEETILREAAEIAVKQELPELLAAQKLNIVEAPRVSIEPPKAGSALIFTARAPLAPEVKLPDYSALAVKENANKKEVSVSNDEHRETLTHLRRERARVEKIETGIAPEQAAEEAQKAEEKDLPALDDEFVKMLGYESLDQFTEKVREHIANEKTLQAKSAHRALLLETLVKKTSVSYPVILREYEIEEMEARFKTDLERIGKTLDHYLAETKKTHEHMHEEWKDAADKRVKIRLMLVEIAREEHLEADEAAVTREVTVAQKQFPQASPESLRAHIAHALRNEKVLEWLESRS